MGHGSFGACFYCGKGMGKGVEERGSRSLERKREAEVGGVYLLKGNIVPCAAVTVTNLMMVSGP